LQAVQCDQEVAFGNFVDEGIAAFSYEGKPGATSKYATKDHDSIPPERWRCACFEVS
jgi:hypothetical protein